MSNKVSIQNMAENREASKTDPSAVESSAQVLIGTMGGGLAVSYYDYEAKVNELNSLLDERIEECKDYFRQVKELERKLEETNQNCDGWFADVKSLRSQVDSKDQEIERLKEQLGNRVNELGIVESTVETLIAEKSQFIEEIAKLKEKVHDLKNENERISTAREKETSELMKRGNEIAAKAITKQIENEELRNEVSRLRRFKADMSLFFADLEHHRLDVFQSINSFAENFEIEPAEEVRRIIGNWNFKS